jgi:hypothetical protein
METPAASDVLAQATRTPARDISISTHVSLRTTSVMIGI